MILGVFFMVVNKVVNKVWEPVNMARGRPWEKDPGGGLHFTGVTKPGFA